MTFTGSGPYYFIPLGRLRRFPSALTVAALLRSAYAAGRELCRSYVVGEPERFRRLTEQVRVATCSTRRDSGAAISTSP
jgi:hypothetical protein